MKKRTEPDMAADGMSRYQMRYAAGIYWLLDMKQPGYPYKKPLPLNEQGAHIWEMTKKGMDLDQISEALGEEYGVSADQVREDIREFYEQLKQQGIIS